MAKKRLPANETPALGLGTGATGKDAAWRGALREALAAESSDGFVASLRTLGEETTDAWEHADAPELAGLERWGTELAERDPAKGLAALVAAAIAGFPIAVAAGGDALDHMGFHASEKQADGAPVEAQIALVASWLADPQEPLTRRIDLALDRTRQLHAWDEDLRPTDDVAFYWYLEVGQCCCAAALGVGDDPAGDSYYAWPAATTVGRGLVLAARGVRFPGTMSADAVATLYAGMVG